MHQQERRKKSWFQKERKIKGMEEEVEKEKDNNNNLRESCSTWCKDVLQGHRSQSRVEPVQE